MTRSLAVSEKVWPQPQGKALGGGAVEVSVLVPASAAEAWRALVDRDIVGCWFGNLSESLKPGGSHRLDFGDGDFFDIHDVILDAPRRLAYRWRFLGTGPVDTISWSIQLNGSGCLVAVTDFEPSRTADGCREMIEGWTDFLHRLQAYCLTGKNTRYPWRSEFGGSIELPLDAGRAFGRLLSAEGYRHWMPWFADALTAGKTLTMKDKQKPGQLMIERIEKTGDTSLSFTLTCPEWRATTECRLDVQAWPGGSLLTVIHTGWPNIDARKAEQAAQRLRFGTLWTEALRTARMFLLSEIETSRQA